MRGLAPFVALLAVLAAGCAMLVRAGRLQAAGRIDDARRRARAGGFVAAAGSLLAAIGALALPAGTAAGRASVAAMMLGSGGAALLAGASGKPRPTVWSALALLLAGLVVAAGLVR
ncbi:MAG TPA: hypothetical protein VFB67_01335 [Candidatus Polarisedimenticolaceae bacterium]|nr:hypothetical protein [Candidatus Polarisedimenticolaceae bacterium]